MANEIDKLNLSNLTVADIRGLKDESLKKTLMEAVQRSTDVNSHQNHGSHGDHSTTVNPIDQHQNINNQ